MSNKRFWNSKAMQPKRAFTWLLELGSGDTQLAQWIARTTQRPTYNVNETSHSYLNHNFWFPGTVEWDPIDVTIIDPISHNAAEVTKEMILQSGYRFPTERPGTPEARQTVSKRQSVNALGGNVTLEQLKSDGEVIDVYELVNPWIQTIDYSEFDYDSDDLAEITLTIRFDWAEVNSKKTGQSNIVNNVKEGVDDLIS